MLASIGDKPCVIPVTMACSPATTCPRPSCVVDAAQRACDLQRIAAGSVGALSYAVSAEARAQCVREAGPPSRRCVVVYAALVHQLDQAGARYAD